jgi:hypothetical protein
VVAVLSITKKGFEYTLQNGLFEKVLAGHPSSYYQGLSPKQEKFESYQSELPRDRLIDFLPEAYPLP